MEESGNRQKFIEKKAFELSYALLRLAGSIGRQVFKEHLEHQALSLLQWTFSEEPSKTRRTLALIEHFARLCGDIGVVSPSNANLLAHESAKLNSAIAELGKEQKLPEADLQEFFSSNESNVNSIIDLETASGTSEPVPELGIPDEATGKSEEGESSHSTINAAMRQSAILEQMRQKNDCRIKDLQGSFPEVSERTLRYDLQSLVEQGLIARVGSGGPGTYYRLRVFEA